MNQIIKNIEAAQLKASVEEFNVGDTVKVNKCTKISFDGGSSAREVETDTVHLLFSINFWGHK